MSPGSRQRAVRQMLVTSVASNLKNSPCQHELNYAQRPIVGVSMIQQDPPRCTNAHSHISPAVKQPDMKGRGDVAVKVLYLYMIVFFTHRQQ